MTELPTRPRDGMCLTACALAGTLVAFGNTPAVGQEWCPPERPACPSGYSFESGGGKVGSGSCQSGPNWLGHRSHCPLASSNVCTGAERLDAARGVCTTGVPPGRPACPSGFSFESGGGQVGSGRCQSGPNWLGHRSHCPLASCNVCTTAERLDWTHGLCCPPVATPRPDLVISRAFLRATSGGGATTTIRRGQRYWACFEVANVGTANSGPFRVGGGGLGVPTPPFLVQASLSPGASRLGCLVYPTTPPPGSYVLVLGADSLSVVPEIREDNNRATITVRIEP